MRVPLIDSIPVLHVMVERLEGGMSNPSLVLFFCVSEFR